MNQPHHDEQMEACRRDFAVQWAPIELAMQARGCEGRAVAMEQMRRWRIWLKERLPTDETI